MQIISWNVNGVRAAQRKGFLDWLDKGQADIVCLQETKAHEDQLDEQLRFPDGYKSWWHLGERKGYSGVAVYSKQEPKSIKTDFGKNNILSHEGRTIMADFGNFKLFNIYFPNGKKNKERLHYKLDFYKAFLDEVTGLMKLGESVIVCGDVNTAHKDIDLARPDANRNVSGFLPEECAWLDQFLDVGLIDTFREFEQGPEHYTWWDMKTRARDRNVGWRIDYFYISSDLRPQLKNAFILKDVMGSDHCPIGIDITV